MLARVLILLASGQVAQTPTDGVHLYETRVKPVLEAQCLKCHGNNPERLRSGLSILDRAGLLRGGERGPAIDTAEPDRSLLLQAIGYADDDLQMPPSGRLSDKDIEAITQWVRLGAPYGGSDDDVQAVAAEDTFEITDADRSWWSVRPHTRPTTPDVRDTSWPANDIDRFILARLEAEGLTPATDADRRTLIRRATYDLTGLPPTTEDVAAFVADDAPDAYDRLLDRLLASPQYGVKWGRHWLDLVRFAETDSYERDRLKPGAWRYRDWVIDALNNDMPYDEFLVHQLAGDEIDTPTANSIIATGYLRLGIWDDEPTDVALAQYDDLDSILDTTCRVMLGVSMGCARCHDHKGDPISQRDYYSMLAFFRGVAPYKVGGGNTTTPSNYVDSIPADLGVPGVEDRLRVWHEERASILAALRPDGDEKIGAWGISTLIDRGLVTHLAFEDESALVAVDATGLHHGRVADATAGVDGVRGKAFSFDGKDDSVRIERPVTDDFTISFWFRTSEKARGGTDLRWFLGNGLVDGEVPGIVNDFGVALVGEGHVTAGTGNPETFLHSGPGYHDGRWHHVALARARESGRVVLYVDGNVVAEATGSTASLDTPAFLDIGRMHPGHGHFEGDLDEVGFYARALGPRQVMSLFVGGGSGDAYEAGIDRLLASPMPRRERIEVLRVKEPGPQPPETHVLIRGNPHAPSVRVEPAYPQILDEAMPVLIPAAAADATSSGRRLALAKWIVDPGNIRTARVMANRLWQYHFGRGLVPTPNDFGRFGLPPTHPRLLDWLGAELVSRGWSLKAMHRLIMKSHAYRMGSRADPAALTADPENTLLWRFDMRRLAAEEIRDSILTVNGTLNLAMGGPGVYPPMPAEVLATASRPGQAWGTSTPEQAARRSVYIHVKRSLLTPLLETLDLADTDSTCPVRFVTTQPTQALTMLNSVFMNDAASLLAARVSGEAGPTPRDRVACALELLLTRTPEPDEIDKGIQLIQELEREDGFSPEAAFTSYCLVLLNLNEFVYLD